MTFGSMLFFRLGFPALFARSYKLGADGRDLTWLCRWNA